MRQLEVFGIGSCVAAGDPGCSLAPGVLRASQPVAKILQGAGLHLAWQAIIQPPGDVPREAAVAAVCAQIGRLVHDQVERGRPFVCFGGDHSCAMGIWAGAMRALGGPERLGLIWVDAHMDAHTYASSPSGNLHGMPVAALLGQSDPALARIYADNPVLPAANLALLGVHSFEPAEQALIRRLQVPLWPMGAELRGERLAATLAAIYAELAGRCARVGISIDLDAVDPRDAPGVGTPAPGGLSGRDLCAALKGLRGASKLLGLELAEFNPLYDQERRTERLIAELVAAIYGERSSP